MCAGDAGMLGPGKKAIIPANANNGIPVGAVLPAL